MPRKHVAGGYCFQSDDQIGASFCALEFGQCRSEDQIFRSSREALSAGAFTSCYSRSAVDKIYLGVCGDRCAADASSCGNAQFTPADGSSSSSTRDPNCQVSNALFGNCGGRCVWSADACENGESFHLPGGVGTGGGGEGGGSGGGGGPKSVAGSGTEGGENECTCDKVQVGGCKYPGVPIYCAVSPDSCDEFQTYLSHKEVFKQENIECYLCREPTTSSPVASPVSSPRDNPTLPSSNSATNNTSIIMVIILSSIGVAAIIIVGADVVRRRRLKEEHERDKKETYPNQESPPVSVTFRICLDNEATKVSSQHLAEIEEHSIGDMSCLTQEA